MAEFVTKCPYCSAGLQVQDESIGKEVVCQQCQKKFIISPPSSRDSITPSAPPIQSECCEKGTLSFCELIGSSWNILCRRPGVAFGFSALLVLIYLSFDICRVATIFLTKGNVTAIVISLWVYIILTTFVCPIFLCWLMLNALRLQRNQEINPGSIFLYIKPNQWMHFLWGFWRPALFATLWGLLLIIPGIIAMIKYWMTVYILLDKPELSVKEAMKLSSEITMGHKLKIFGAVFVIMMIVRGKEKFSFRRQKRRAGR